MLSTATADIFLHRASGDHFVQNRLFAFALAQDAAQPLYMLTDRPGPRKHDRHAGFRYIDPLVEHLGGRQRQILAAVEALQNRFALFSWGLMGNGGGSEGC